jgi:hypothetical protein
MNIQPKAPALPIHGQCQCGNATFTIAKMPLAFYACHCTECQAQSASAFGLSLWVEKSAFKRRGKVKSWTRNTDSGGKLTCHFCPNCGTRLWHESDAIHPDFGPIVSVKGGTMGVMRSYQPAGHIWTISKHAATCIPKDVLAYEKGNIDDLALARAWQKSLQPTKI